jgi:hypothetical protein
MSGLANNLDNSKADCHLLVALPIFTSARYSSAPFGSYVRSRHMKNMRTPKAAIRNGTTKNECTMTRTVEFFCSASIILTMKLLRIPKNPRRPIYNPAQVSAKGNSMIL